MFLQISRRIAFLLALMITGSPLAWDHPGHMTTAAIAFKDIAESRPELIEKLQLLFLSHPDTAPFWVAAGEAKGKERVRRMFLECARWADDSKFTPRDMLTWHSARWPILTDDAPDGAKAAVAAMNGRPIGQGIDALRLNFGMLRNHESTAPERALGLCWVMHIVGDIHQPWHVSELYSAEFPTGNAAAGLSYVEDPVTKSAIPLHILWDSNTLRVPSLEAVDEAAARFTKRYPRDSFPELKSHPVDSPEFFMRWTRESHQVALDWAADIEAVRDTSVEGGDSEALVANLIKFILDGVSSVESAPPVPDEYWEKLQSTAERRITLAGYRIADLLIASANDIMAQREFIGR